MEDAHDTSPERATLLYIGAAADGGRLLEWLRQRPSRYRTLFALQGRLGCELAKRHAPDIVLVSSAPPDMPAREVITALRAAGLRRPAPVLLVEGAAARGPDDAPVFGDAEPADAVLPASCSGAELWSTVERLLGRGA